MRKNFQVIFKFFLNSFFVRNIFEFGPFDWTEKLSRTRFLGLSKISDFKRVGCNIMDPVNFSLLKF